ncbi:hypothetical protein RRG08_058940 [Elysia crispata]|uniref:Uncharacterized protein n=1 Tax=Elysia crispata TaxID=231223 RepID=A0AAE0XRA8_9GAST|nr:hypothetical protein RRG08_058940 [Elysia crispata]
MDRFVQPIMKALHHFIVTPMRGDKWNADLTHVRNFVPMQFVLDQNGQPRIHAKYGFTLTKPMDHDDLMKMSVTKWVTPAPAMQAMEYSVRNTVNVIKGFMNVNGTAVFLHDTTSNSKASKHCNFRKHSHLHIIVQSTKGYTRDLNKFRAMEHTLRNNEVELFTSTIKCTPDSLLKYMTSDPEKSYLGSNVSDLRIAIQRLYEEAADDVTAELMLVSSPQPQQQSTKRKRDMYEIDDNTEDDDDDDDDGDNNQEELIITIDDDDVAKERQKNTKKPMDYLRQPPTKKPKRSKNLVMLDELKVKAAMLRHPHCATFPELVAAARGTADYDLICNCYLDALSEKLWALARDDIAPPDTSIDLMSCLESLNDDLPNTLTPEQTLALFNSWCSEQNVNAHKIAWFIVSRLQGRVYKKNRTLSSRFIKFRQDLLDVPTLFSSGVDDGENEHRRPVLLTRL